MIVEVHMICSKNIIEIPVKRVVIIMKGKGKFYLIGFIVVIILIWFLPKIFIPSPKVGLPASCYISEQHYWPTKTTVQDIDKSYVLYGTISEQKDEEELTTDLSTTDEKLLHKKVFMNQKDVSSIYIKTDDGYQMFKTEQTIYE